MASLKFTDGKKYIKHALGKTVLEISDGIDTVFFPLKSFCNFLALHKDDVARFVSVADEPDDDEEEVVRRVNDGWNVMNNLPGESLQLTELRQRLAILSEQRQNLFNAASDSIRPDEELSSSPFWSQYLDALEVEQGVGRDIMALTTPSPQPQRSVPPHTVPLQPFIPETAEQRQTRLARARSDAISRDAAIVRPQYLQNAAGEVAMPPNLQADINAMYQSRAQAISNDVEMVEMNRRAARAAANTMRHFGVDNTQTDDSPF